MIKASETRLKAGSKYIYDRVQQLFGKDASDRFILMCTFADDKTPKVIEALDKSVQWEKYFTFNNSALETPWDQGTSATKFYWETAMDGIKQFSEYVIQANREPFSLNMSR